MHVRYFLSASFSKSKRCLQILKIFTSAALGEYLFALSSFSKCLNRKSNRDINVAMWRVSKEEVLQISSGNAQKLKITRIIIRKLSLDISVSYFILPTSLNLF